MFLFVFILPKTMHVHYVRVCMCTHMQNVCSMWVCVCVCTSTDPPPQLLLSSSASSRRGTSSRGSLQSLCNGRSATTHTAGDSWIFILGL